MTKPRTRIFIVDDHPMLRELLANYLRLQADLEVVGEADSPAAAMAAMKAAKPDVAVVDLTLKRGSGLELIKELRLKLPDVRVVVLSMHEEITDLERAFRAGAQGYVMKRESSGQILDAIRQVREGRVFANPDVLGQLTARFLDRPARTSTAPSEILSNRELEVFQRLGAGQSIREISTDLGLTVKTVQTYCDRIKEKLGLEDGRELNREAFRWHEARSHPRDVL